jgi:flagellar hook-associated protein 3 FlgL
MMRVTTTSQYKTQVDLFSRQYEEAWRLQASISSGKKLQNDSDAPEIASNIHPLKAMISQLATYHTNITYALNRTSMSDALMGSAVDLIKEAQGLIERGQTDTLNDYDRASIANSLSFINSSLLNIANSQDENQEYYFSGDFVNSPPFIEDSGSYLYNGSYIPTAISLADNYAVLYSDVGESVFGNIATANGSITVFDVINNAVAALNTPASDNTGRAALHSSLETSIGQMNTSLTNITNYWSEIGSRADIIQRQQDLNENMDLNDKMRLGSFQDTDLAKAIAELNQKNTILELTLGSYNKIQDALSRLLR